jgi:DNA adenine methylase
LRFHGFTPIVGSRSQIGGPRAAVRVGRRRLGEYLKSSAHGPSFLRWAGSKRQSLTLLAASYSDAGRHYVEPFAGSAALFFSLKPLSGTLGDLNGHLVNAMRHVRDQPRRLHQRLSKIPRNPHSYYRVRSEFNSLRPYGLDAAVLFSHRQEFLSEEIYQRSGCGKSFQKNQLAIHGLPINHRNNRRQP